MFGVHLTRHCYIQLVCALGLMLGHTQQQTTASAWFVSVLLQRRSGWIGCLHGAQEKGPC